jgi:hypothetical protein
MYQMAFFGKIDIYAVKNGKMRYLWMLKSTYSVLYHSPDLDKSKNLIVFAYFLAKKIFADTLKKS